MSHILVIYDDEAVRVTIGKILQFDDHDVALTADGEGGVQRFCKQTFDLVICDTIMTNEGLETLRQIRMLSAGVPIISILESATSSDISGPLPRGLLRMSSGLGSTRTLAKPFTGSDLLGLVRESLCSESRSHSPTVHF
jgi:two-component system response regulator MprA